MIDVVRPDVRAFLDGMAAAPRPPFSDSLIAMIRRMPPESMPSPDLPVGELAVVRDLEAPGPAGPIRMRLFDGRSTRDRGPIAVFFHGGGFVVGSIETHAGLAAEIARRLDLPVISVDYRLAPENPWPAAPDDAEAAVRWIAENGASFGREADGLVLVGDSAGGSLVIVTALALRDRPAAAPVELLWPIYPATDLKGGAEGAYESGRLFDDGYGMTPADSAYFRSAYKADTTSWRASPLRTELGGLPPTLVVTAGLDSLRDQGRAFAAKAIQAGVDVSYREYTGTIHGFATYRAGIASAREDVCDMVRIAASMIGAHRVKSRSSSSAESRPVSTGA